MNLNELAVIKKSMSPLVGEGLRLRLLTMEDLPATLAWRNQENIRHHFIHSDIITWENHVLWWEKYKSKSDDFVFIIEETQQLKRPVGQISLYNIDLSKGEAEYGRLMIGDNDARGKGLAKRATTLLLSWAFNSISLQRIYLEVYKNNTVAINLYENCGFKPFGERDRLYLMAVTANIPGIIDRNA